MIECHLIMATVASTSGKVDNRPTLDVVAGSSKPPVASREPLLEPSLVANPSVPIPAADQLGSRSKHGILDLESIEEAAHHPRLSLRSLW